MVMRGRNFSIEIYRFGWNTQEKTDEISGVGNHYKAKFWEYDNRVNRRWNRDRKPVSWESHYAVKGNNPMLYNDPNGTLKPNLELIYMRYLTEERHLKTKVVNGE